MLTGMGSCTKLQNQLQLKHMVRVAPESRIHWFPMSLWSDRETIAWAVSVMDRTVSALLSSPLSSATASFADGLGVGSLVLLLVSSRAFFSFWHSKMLWPLSLQCAQFLLFVGLSTSFSHLSLHCAFFPALAKNVAAVPPDSTMRHCSSRRMQAFTSVVVAVV